MEILNWLSFLHVKLFSCKFSIVPVNLISDCLHLAFEAKQIFCGYNKLCNFTV